MFACAVEVALWGICVIDQMVRKVWRLLQTVRNTVRLRIQSIAVLNSFMVAKGRIGVGAGLKIRLRAMVEAGCAKVRLRYVIQLVFVPRDIVVWQCTVVSLWYVSLCIDVIELGVSQVAVLGISRSIGKSHAIVGTPKVHTIFVDLS